MKTLGFAYVYEPDVLGPETVADHSVIYLYYDHHNFSNMNYE